MVRKLFSALLVAGSFTAATATLSACSTVKGAGEDVKSVSECTEAMMHDHKC